MSLKKKTIRRLPEKTREIARIINELESVLQRLKNRLPVIAGLEFESQALAKARSLISLQSARETVKKAAQETSEQDPLFPDNTPQENPARKKRQRKEKVSHEPNTEETPPADGRVDEPRGADDTGRPGAADAGNSP